MAGRKGSEGRGRADGRPPGSLRPVTITRGVLRHAEGSALIETGFTKVICSASVEEKVPAWIKGQGWVTAEYAMLPRSTPQRKPRESTQGRVGGRTHEIQRLIGRALRAVTDLGSLGERTIWIDCDIIEADGGTRTAAITGSLLALVEACARLRREGKLPATVPFPVRDFLAATSMGIVDGVPLLDLAYEEDVRAEVDMNLVMTGDGRIVELQGTAEKAPFSDEQLERLLELGRAGVRELVAAQRAALGDLAVLVGSGPA